MEEKEMNKFKELKKKLTKIKIKKIDAWRYGTFISVVLLIISILTGGFGGLITGAAVSGDTGEIVSDENSIILLNDKRCEECDTTGLVGQLKSTFPDLEIIELDYSSKNGKIIYNEIGLTALPAVLFDEGIKNKDNYGDIERYLEQKGDFLSLMIGAGFDPETEICDNGIDDNGNRKVDCDDETCASEWKCMEKMEKPEVELFVMSYCPYGTQIEKGMLPVVELLGDKIDFELKFCDYAMHDKTELDEQTVQYCIQEGQNDKFIDYLTCFLEDGTSDRCIIEAGIDQSKLNSCVKATDSKFKITESYNDKSTWKGNFPTFTIYQEEVDKYSVGGSPTLIINGVTAKTGRDAASLLNAVCYGFSDNPNECDEVLDSASPSPGFGFSTSSGSASGGCEV